MPREDVVERHEGAGCGRAVVVPDVGVVGVGPEGGGPRRDDVVLGGGGEVFVGGEVCAAALAGLLDGGRYDDDCVDLACFPLQSTKLESWGREDNRGLGAYRRGRHP